MTLDRLHKTLPGIAVLLALLSCSRTAPASFECSHVEYADSTGNVFLTINLELPTASASPVKTVRDFLLSEFVGRLERFGCEEDAINRLYPYEGEPGDLVATVAHYGRGVYSWLDSLAAVDAREMMQYGGTPNAWEYQVGMEKTVETESYVVFNSTNYVYMGGAHGGVTGSGAMTFRKSDGALIRNVIDRSRLMDMQNLIKEGLESYGEDIDYLFIEDGIYPLPVWEPSLSEDGVVFVYQQYEIAPYAYGMPSFTIPYDKVIDFLTPEARALSGRHSGS